MYVMYADMQDCVWSCRFLVIRFHRSNFGNKIRLTDDPGVALSAFHFFFLGEDKGGAGQLGRESTPINPINRDVTNLLRYYWLWTQIE